MSVLWTKTKIAYTVQAAEGHSVMLLVGAAGVDEGAVDSAMEAFASSYNLTYEVTSVTKAYEGNGVSDWTYDPNA